MDRTSSHDYLVGGSSSSFNRRNSRLLQRRRLLPLFGAAVMTLVILIVTRSKPDEKDFVAGDDKGQVSAQSQPFTCSDQFYPDVDTLGVFPTLGFNDTYLMKRYYWFSEDFDFEKRYWEKFKPLLNKETDTTTDDGDIKIPKAPLVKVFVVPHSHDDAGWLKTYQDYYDTQVKFMLDNIVEKLDKYRDMTFVLRDIAFLDLWWDQASTAQKLRLKSLVRDEGRVEILTGGWVMPDEATMDLYTMIDQLIEGRQYVKQYLGVGMDKAGKVGWSIDPFGQGSLMPYILKKAGVENMVIGRLHYGWKKYLAKKELINFNWVQRWDTDGSYPTTCHNLEYDLYLTKHTCGPNPDICVQFDFQTVNGMHQDLLWEKNKIIQSNITLMSRHLVDQLQRTASLGNTNVVLFPVGNDFSFYLGTEWDEQYGNYTKLFNHINNNTDEYQMEIGWGTVSGFFDAMQKSKAEKGITFPTLSGDFFPYSDILAGRPVYWTGYYTTRPYWKRFHRETSAELRSAEILFTYTRNLVQGDGVFDMNLRQEYQHLLKARRNLGLFAHHDGITGTSPALVMSDFGKRLLSAYETGRRIQEKCLKAILAKKLSITHLPITTEFQSDFTFPEFGTFKTLQEHVIYSAPFNSYDRLVKKVVLFNSLTFKRVELVTLMVSTPNVIVKTVDGETIMSQVNPVLTVVQGNELRISKDKFEMNFLAEIEPLSFNIYEVHYSEDGGHLAEINCRNCSLRGGEGPFRFTPSIDSVILRTEEQTVQFNNMGLPETVDRPDLPHPVNINMSFTCYTPELFSSGAYLLKLNINNTCSLNHTSAAPIVKVQGPITSYITAFHTNFTTKTLVHNIQRNMHVRIQSTINAWHKTGAEYAMRFDTGFNTDVIFTDQSGFTMEKRKWVKDLEYNGNHYPITTMVHLEHKGIRVGLAVDRPHGAAVPSPESLGLLEVMVERVSLYDDGRGMGEGVTDQKPVISEYILLIEGLTPSTRDPEMTTNNFEETIDIGEAPADIDEDKGYSSNLLTLTAQRSSLFLNYPLNQFGFDALEGGTTGSFHLIHGAGLSEVSHLISLRTLSEAIEEDGVTVKETDSSKALMVMQKRMVCWMNVDNLHPLYLKKCIFT